MSCRVNDPDLQRNLTQARQIMEKLGYGPEKRLKLKVSTRDLLIFRDPAVILIDQLKEVYCDGDREAGVPENRWIRFRAGVNLGDVIVEDGTSLATVSMSRLASRRSPSQAVSASRVWCTTRSATSRPTFEDLGEQSVKNIARPVPNLCLAPGRRRPFAAVKCAGLHAGLSARCCASLVGRRAAIR